MGDRVRVPKVCLVKVHVLCFDMILISSLARVLIPNYPFLEKFGRAGKRSFSAKATNFHRGSLSMSSESTCSKPQYDPYLI